MQHAEYSVSGVVLHAVIWRHMEKPRKRLVDDARRRASSELVAASALANFRTVHANVVHFMVLPQGF